MPSIYRISIISLHKNILKPCIKIQIKLMYYWTQQGKIGIKREKIIIYRTLRSNTIAWVTLWCSNSTPSAKLLHSQKNHQLKVLIKLKFVCNRKLFELWLIIVIIHSVVTNLMLWSISYKVIHLQLRNNNEHLSTTIFL